MKLVKKQMAVCVMSAIIAGTSPLALGYEFDDEIPFDDARIFFELNNTDGDLGIHAQIDGDAWNRLEIEDPNERRMLKIRVTGRLKRQGLTEIFFESAEPNFDELSPEEFFARFPEGMYEIEGVTLQGEEMESEVMLSHVMPAPVENVTISGEIAADDCDATLPLVSAPFFLAWDAVTSSHPELGKYGDIEVEYYELVIENEDTGLANTIQLTGDVTEWEVSEDFIGDAEEIKFEILTRATNGNKTAVESCFEVE